MRPPGLVAWVVYHARWFRAVLVQAGYRIRPYDQLADRRRWVWQPRTRCGLPVDLAAAFAAGIAQGEADYREWKTEHPEDAARWEALLKHAETRQKRR